MTETFWFFRFIFVYLYWNLIFNEFMDETKKFQNLMLDQAKASIYSDVDGLSLQNLFFTKNGYFPNCFMFSRSGKEGGDNHFDTIRILEHFKETKSTDSFQYIK